MLKDIYIWGAGKYGDMAYIYYKDDCNILGYIDSMPEKCGTLKNGISIYAPDILKNKAVAVVIAVRNNEGIEKKTARAICNSKHFLFSLYGRGCFCCDR